MLAMLLDYPANPRTQHGPEKTNRSINRLLLELISRLINFIIISLLIKWVSFFLFLFLAKGLFYFKMKEERGLIKNLVGLTQGKDCPLHKARINQTITIYNSKDLINRSPTNIPNTLREVTRTENLNKLTMIVCPICQTIRHRILLPINMGNLKTRRKPMQTLSELILQSPIANSLLMPGQNHKS